MSTTSNEVYIVQAKRSAIGSFGGALSGTKITSIARDVVKAALIESGLEGESIDEVIFGNVLQAGLGQNPARQVAIGAGIPEYVPAFTVNKVCASSMKAIALAAQSIADGQNDIVLAGGLESMSDAPYLVPKARFGCRMGNAEFIDSMINDGLWEIFNDYHMGITAENLAAKYRFSRQQQDQVACESQTKAKAAQQSGRFKDEIVPLQIKTKKEAITFDTDECVRGDTTLQVLATLKPAFKKDGTVTAGNASTISDGAAAVLLASADALKRYKLVPLAKMIDFASAGVLPSEMGLGIVESTKKVLKKTSLSLNQIVLLEINEAFASVFLAAERELKLDRETTNVNGGAIALGHPIGTSGARIVVTLIHEMKKRKSKLGLASLCAGGGMGMAMIMQGM